VRFEGPDLTSGRLDPQRRSAPVAPGAVQSTPGGLIVLGPASGTMGGYPHVGHVISADLDRLAQLRAGDAVRFGFVGLAEARRLDRERLAFLRSRDVRIAVLP
jgi:allophanate hydrolase subunit 2